MIAAPRRTSLRRALPLVALLGAALLPACGDDTPAPPPVELRPLHFDYLTKLRLNVASIDVDDAYSPAPVPGGSAHVEAQAPVQPADALRRMAADRLVPAGGDGHAVMVIEDASLVQTAGRYEGDLKVRLDVTSGDGSRTGHAEARVSRTRTIVDPATDATPAALYELVRQMMDDMNVELEFQVRHALRDYLQGSADAAPEPGPVQQQDLAPPPKAAPAP